VARCVTRSARHIRLPVAVKARYIAPVSEAGFIRPSPPPGRSRGTGCCSTALSSSLTIDVEGHSKHVFDDVKLSLGSCPFICGLFVRCGLVIDRLLEGPVPLDFAARRRGRPRHRRGEADADVWRQQHHAGGRDLLRHGPSARQCGSWKPSSTLGSNRNYGLRAGLAGAA